MSQEDFQKKLNYRFKKEALLREALTHKSFSVEENKHQHHNERLEFLGDSVLNFVVAERLLKLFPSEQEGVLSKKRASLVNLNKLAEVSKKFELQNYMLFGPGEIKQGNHLNARIHGSCFEALIGAIYLDSDFETAKAWTLKQFNESDFQQEAEAYSADFKSRLQELTQKQGSGTPSYDVVLTTGPSHKPQFVVALKINGEEKTRADGASKKQAEQKAAEIYLNELVKVQRK
ncbi:MAG: ribonuclease [Pseudobdellovibrio sp.]|jgi:ribonuclease-3|nr:ribonuclease [Pseudobdellovibrio sp.]